jgi:hypothetical protein
MAESLPIRLAPPLLDDSGSRLIAGRNPNRRTQMEKKKKKLTLSRETVRVLRDGELGTIVGGGDTAPGGDACTVECPTKDGTCPTDWFYCTGLCTQICS